MRPTWTPGDWDAQIAPEAEGIRWEVVADGPRRVCVLSRREEAGSNARLIAAAPKLHDALRELHDCVSWSDTMQAWVLAGPARVMPVLDRTRAVLAALAPAGEVPGE